MINRRLNNQVHLFLDLESTIVTPLNNGWDDFEFINLEKIKAVIQHVQPSHINIFSFAVRNLADHLAFNEFILPKLQELLEMHISHVPTMIGDIMPACHHVKNIATLEDDLGDVELFLKYWGKQEAFRIFCRHMFSRAWSTWGNTTKVMLLDDDVINEDFNFPDLKLSGQIRNIDTL